MYFQVVQSLCFKNLQLFTSAFKKSAHVHTHVSTGFMCLCDWFILINTAFGYMYPEVTVMYFHYRELDDPNWWDLNCLFRSGRSFFVHCSDF